MCVAAIAWQAHPRWRLVAVGNRDEFHERPAAPLAAWDDERIGDGGIKGGGIIAGRDLRSGGTWLGVTPAGRFALVTNLRGHGGPRPCRVSRGTLVHDLLTASGDHGDPAAARLQDFNPFNLFLADTAQAQFLSNRPGDVRAHLPHGVYGLSNGPLDQPWPKTLQLKGALTDWLTSPDSDHADGLAPLFAPLFTALRSERLSDIGLRVTEPSDVAREAPKTPVFIRDPVYGTRCSTVVAIDRDGAGTIAERRFDADGTPTGETTIHFRWPQ